jgi:transcriptional regulator with XRE-family HTH domain
MNEKTVGQRVQQARDRRVLARTELAKAAGISYQSLWLIEEGRREPRRATIRRLAAALDVDPVWLLTGEAPA